MKTPREENFVELISIDNAKELNVKKLGYIWHLPTKNVNGLIQHVMDYAESPKELVQLLMGVIAIQREVIDSEVLQIATALSLSEFDKLELFGKAPSFDEIIDISTRYNTYISGFDVHNLHETIGITLINDEFNNWPAIITIYLGLMLELTSFE